MFNIRIFSGVRVIYIVCKGKTTTLNNEVNILKILLFLLCFET